MVGSVKIQEKLQQEIRTEMRTERGEKETHWRSDIPIHRRLLKYMDH